MKKLSFSLFATAALMGFASAQTAYTTPVGYVTNTLLPNQFNLLSLTVNPSTIAAGVIDAKSAAPNTITDNEINFTTLLGAANPPTTPVYILELPNGVVQEITSWSGSVLTTPDDITASVVTGTTSYKLRKAATITDVFGVNNEKAGLSPDTDGSLTGTDTVLVLDANGNFETIYYFDDGAGTTGWFDDQGLDAANKRIIYSDGFYVRRAPGSTKSLVVTGEVKIKPSGSVLNTGFNYVGSVAPVGLTIGNSGLEAFLAPDTDGSLTNTDLIFVINDGVSYTAYYFDDGAGTTGWFDDQGLDASALKLENGFLIRAVGGPKPFTLNVPPSYNNL